MRDNFIAWFLSFYNDIAATVKQPPGVVKKLVIILDLILRKLGGTVSFCGDLSKGDKSVEGGNVSVAADVKALAIGVLCLAVYGDFLANDLFKRRGDEALTDHKGVPT